MRKKKQKAYHNYNNRVTLGSSLEQNACEYNINIEGFVVTKFKQLPCRLS